MADARRISYKWLALLTLSVGTFMATLDASIVNISLPRLTEVFDTDTHTHELLMVFKKSGYSVSNMGNVTGYNQYEVKWGS